MVWGGQCAADYFALQIMKVNMKAILLLLRTCDSVLVLYMPHSFLPRSGLLRRNTHEWHWRHIASLAGLLCSFQEIMFLYCFFPRIWLVVKDVLLSVYVCVLTWWLTKTHLILLFLNALISNNTSDRKVLKVTYLWISIERYSLCSLCWTWSTVSGLREGDFQIYTSFGEFQIWF